jgi:uncharacterized protein YecE (DUF72 family)
MYAGTSGYQYGHWDSGVFYAAGTKNRLEFYLKRFNSLEINSSFYRIPTPETVAKWSTSLPDNFQLVLKVSKLISHMYRLKLYSDSTTISQGIDLLKYIIIGVKKIEPLKRGPVLLQLHPKSKKNVDRLDAVLELFHESSIQVAVELRNLDWLADDTLKVIEQHNCVLASTDWATATTPVVDTSDFVYLRRHGYNARYTNSYPDESLLRDAELIRYYEKLGKRVYIFFNNDGEGFAPNNVLKLQELYANC